MKGIPSTAQRGVAGVLFVAMLSLGVIKAQGCQRPVDESPEPDAVAEQPAATTGAPGVTTAPPSAAGTDVGVDAGTDAGTAATIEPKTPRPMMPATKSGMLPIDLKPVPQQNAAPTQQKSE